MASADGGTPGTAASETSRDCNDDAAPSHPPAPERVSRSRVGAAAWYHKPLSAQVPSRSTTTSARSKLKMHRAPPAPSLTVAKLATAAPTPWLTFETSGGLVPHG